MGRSLRRLCPAEVSWCVSPKAKDELSETDERRASSVKDLRTMMKERAAEGDDLAKLVLERFGDKPDSLLLRFLRARKFDISRSHELMKGWFPESHQLCGTFKSHFNADPSQLSVCYKTRSSRRG